MKAHYVWRLMLVALACAGFSVAVRADNHPRIPDDVEKPVLPEAYTPVATELNGCFECHGVSGASADPQFPILSGQHFYYLYVQLKDFKAGRRASEIMGPVVAELERGEMKLIAQYFAEQSWPNTGFSGDAAKVARGETAAGAGQCVQCHRGGYEGNSGTPRLAGQYRDYLLKTMTDFKTRARANAADKSSLMETFTEEDLETMAEFLADF